MEKNTTPRITKAQKFAMLKAIPAVAENAMLVEFIDHEIDLLSKKNAGEKKLTPQQVANEAFKQAILDAMTADPNRLFTITEIVKEVPACADLTNQRVAALVRQLIEAKAVVRTEDKRKAFFRLA
jgi:hypothetical protein